MSYVFRPTFGDFSQPMNDDYDVNLPTTFVPQDDGLGGANGGGAQGGGQSNGFTQAMLNGILLDRGIHGGCPAGLDGETVDIADGGFNPAADPNAPLILTTEPALKPSAMGDMIKPEAELNVPNGGAAGIGELTTGAVVGAIAVGVAIGVGVIFLGTVIHKFDSEMNKGLYGGQDTKDTGSTGKKPMKEFVQPTGYMDPDANTGGFNSGLSFPDANGNNIGQGHSIPAGIGLDLGLINSLMGGNVTFSPSGFAKLNLGGKGEDFGSLTNLDAVFERFGNVEGFDLDNFGIYLKPDQDFVLDLDGNGKQDMVEWAIDTVVTSSEEQLVLKSLFEENAAYAEMKAIWMENLAEHCII